MYECLPFYARFLVTAVRIVADILLDRLPAVWMVEAAG